MKKLRFSINKFLSFAIFLSVVFSTVTSCRDEEKTKTVVVEKQAENPKEVETDGTSVNVSDEGVEFSTKDGDKKTEVSVKNKD